MHILTRKEKVRKSNTLLIFGTKCEGKFVPVSPTRNVATEHVQCTAAGGLGWWENRISSRLCQPIRDKLWFWKLCVNQCQVDCRSMPPVGQLRVKFFKKCARRSASSGNLCEISLTVLVHAGVGESDWVVDSAAGYRHVSAITIIVHSVHRRLGCCYQVSILHQGLDRRSLMSTMNMK